MTAEGWHGWDDYAAFYDWENAKTVGRRDVGFWRRFARDAAGPVLELGCGTGRVTLPLARAGFPVVGVDRSAEMLAYARRRLRRARIASPSQPARPAAGCIAQALGPGGGPLAAAPSRGGATAGDGRGAGPRFVARLVRGDIRHLPFAPGSFAAALAPYGILQSLLREADLRATLEAVARVLAPGGRFGIDLVPDVPRWKEYRRRVSLVGRQGRKGPLITLIESVTQDASRRLTIFDHEYVVGWGRSRQVRRFTVTFRTLPVPAMQRRLERAGFAVEGAYGGYHGEPLDDGAGTWVVVANRR